MLLPHGTNVNHRRVKDGWCWWYRKYAPGDTILEEGRWQPEEIRKGCGRIHSLYRCGSGGS